jgi:hypothetical protein
MHPVAGSQVQAQRGNGPALAVPDSQGGQQFVAQILGVGQCDTIEPGIVTAKVQVRPVEYNQHPLGAGGGNVGAGTFDQRTSQLRQGDPVVGIEPPSRLDGRERAHHRWWWMEARSQTLSMR